MFHVNFITKLDLWGGLLLLVRFLGLNVSRFLFMLSGTFDGFIFTLSPNKFFLFNGKIKVFFSCFPQEIVKMTKNNYHKMLDKEDNNHFANIFLSVKFVTNRLDLIIFTHSELK